MPPPTPRFAPFRGHSSKQFELVFAFDEVLTFGGVRENISLAQIQTNLTMDSHEEKLHKMIEQSKMTQAKEEADRKAKVFREEKRAAKMAGIGNAMSGIEGGGQGGGGGGGGYGDQHMGGGSSSYGGGGPGGGGDYGGGMDERKPSGYGDGGAYGALSSPREPAAAPSAPKKGMQLGGSSKKMTMMDKLVSEDNLTPLAPLPGAGAGAGGSGSAGDAGAVSAAAVSEATYPVMLVLEEKVSASLNREGALEALDVKGTMGLTATSDEALCCKVVLGPQRDPAFSYQTHPKVDKKAYEQGGELVLKDAAKGFPKAKSVGVLRWSMSTTAEDQVPISINCWPEPDGGDMNVNVEYTAEKAGVELHDVRIVIPLGTSAPPQVLNCDSGTSRHNRAGEELVWEVDMVDGSNGSASLEFNVAQRDADAFFPIMVSFRSKQMNAGVSVAQVVHSATGTPIQYGVTQAVTSDVYKVE